MFRLLARLPDLMDLALVAYFPTSLFHDPITDSAILVYFPSNAIFRIYQWIKKNKI